MVELPHPVAFFMAGNNPNQLYGSWANLREVETYTQGLRVGSQYPRYSPVGLLERLRQAGLAGPAPAGEEQEF